MECFYRYIADGEEKGSALRHAQINLIRGLEIRPCRSTGAISSWRATGPVAFRLETHLEQIACSWMVVRTKRGQKHQRYRWLYLHLVQSVSRNLEMDMNRRVGT
jgi:hypothetical protein